MDEKILDILKELQFNIKDMKTDITEMKTDITDMKTDITNIKTGITDMKTDITNMKTDIKDLKQGQEKIINKLDDVESVNANRHVEIIKDFNDIKDDLYNVEIITSKNWNDIVKLKAVK